MQHTITQHLDPSELEFDLKTALKFLKMPKGAPRAGEVSEQLAALHTRIRESFRPRFQYRLLQVAAAQAPDTIVLQNEMATLHGKAIYRRLARTQAAVLFCVTVGDNYAKKMDGEDARFEAIFIDAVASTMVQATLRRLRETVQNALDAQALKLTPHISPGYPGWDLSEQAKLFALLQPEKVGIRLSAAFYMLPPKSLSGVFGVVPGRTT